MEEISDVTDLSPRVKLYNVILLGISFMLIFTGYNTCVSIEQTVLDSYKEEHEDFRGDGFTSLAIVYTVMAVANWIAPSIISIFGTKYSMIMAGSLYTTYIATLVKPDAIPLYICSVLLGVGTAVLWTSVGAFLTINSDDTTMGRNSAIFITLKQNCLLFGSLYIYYSWRGVKTITDAVRTPVMIGFAAVSGFGTFCMLFLRSQPNSHTEELISSVNEDTPLISRQITHTIEKYENGTPIIVNNGNKPSKATQAWLAFKKATELIKTRDMIQLIVLAISCGTNLALCTVYATAIGKTLAFGEDADRLVGLATTALGVGEILGGISMGLLNIFSPKRGRGHGVMLGMCVHVLGYFLIFVNIPDIATLQKTETFAYIAPNKFIAVASPFLLGIGDACYSTELYAIYGILYSEDSAPAFALSNSLQGIFGAVALICGGRLVLKWQLLFNLILVIFGSLCFFDVNQRLQLRQRLKELESREGH